MRSSGILKQKGKHPSSDDLDEDSIFGQESSTGSMFTNSVMSSKVHTPKISSRDRLLGNNEESSIDAVSEKSEASEKSANEKEKKDYVEQKFVREDESILGFSVDSYGLPVIKMDRVRQRGAMIGGLPLEDAHEEEQSTSSEDFDLETGSEFSSALPKSLWQDASTNEVRNHSRNRRDSSIHKPRKASTVWIIMGVTTILVIGAVVAVAIAVFGGKNNVKSEKIPIVLTQRQQRLKDIVANVSSPAVIDDLSTPQGKATNWLLFDDQLWLNPGEGTSEQRVIQRYALAVFFFSTGESVALRGGGWLSGEECGAKPWSGLNCYPEKNLVRSLAIDRQNLIGSVPDEVGHLTKMQNFIIKNNEGITGTIPKTIGNLKELRQLGIYFCNIEGAIPEDLFGASKLEYINFQDNELTGNISTKIGELKSLHTLVLTANKLEGQVPFREMASTSLKFLGLSENAFTGSLDQAIGDFQHLEFLYLDGNMFTGEIPVTLSSATNLKSLNLDRNKISGGLPTSLGNMAQLEFFSAQFNSIKGSIPEEVGSLTSLMTLNLDSNALTGSVPDLSNLVALRHLLLSRNELKGTIPSAVTLLQNLEIVFLSSNDFSGSIPEFNFPGGGTYKIRGLYLSDNKLTGSITQSICTLTSLEALFLDENQLEGAIPDCIGNLGQLQQLHLFKNKLSGDIPVDSMASLRQLSSLGLENNSGLKGQIPEDFCENSSATIDVWADCSGGTSASVSCPCCSVCCPSDECI